MPSFSSVDWTEDGLGNPVKMHANKELITDVLKGELGFDGLRDLRLAGDPPDPGRLPRRRCRPSVQRRRRHVHGADPGPDNPNGWDAFIPTLTQLVDDGAVPMSRIDDAVSRILTAKFELGLFEHPFTDRRNIDTIGSKAHRKVARRAVAESQVLLQEQAAARCRSAPARSSRCTSPAATPTTSATRPAAGR